MKLLLATELVDDVEPRLPADIQVVHIDPEGAVDSDASDAEAYFRWWSAQPGFDQVFRIAPRLRWVHTPSAGVEHLLTPELYERDVLFTNGAGTHAISIAEFVLTFMLYHATNFAAFRAAQDEHRWSPHMPRQELMDATLLIIGLGGIGRAIAERAAAFGMHIWGSRRTPHPMPGIERVVGADEWRALLPNADYVVLVTPLTPETRGMFDEAAIRALRPTAYVINVARGAVLDEAALLSALQEGRIAGAALDTFTTEPLPPDSPFWSLPNVVITPHTTALSSHMRLRMVDLFLDNLNRYMQRRPLRNVVDKAAGY